MTKNFLFALMASTLLAAPAMAQSSGSQSGGQAGCAALHASMQSQSGTSGGSGGSSGSQPQSGSSGGSGSSTASASLASADQVEQKLKQSGLSDVQVFDASYFVEATAPNNECVLMLIDTSTMASMSAKGSSGSSASESSGTSSSSGTSASGGSGPQAAKDQSSKNVVKTLEQAGYSDVRVLDATYAASASLEGGEPVMMVVGAESAMQQSTTR